MAGKLIAEFQKIANLNGWTFEEIAKRWGKSEACQRKTVNNRKLSMHNVQQKLQCLLFLSICLIFFAISLTMILLDLNVVVRIAGLLTAFFSGWGCSYSLYVMSSCIKIEK